jgi:zinc ribbon protein
LEYVGYVLIVLGAMFVGFTGVFFYQYFQNAIAAGLSSASGSTASTTAALDAYNGTANMPIFISISIFGVAFLIMGAIFVAGGHIGEALSERVPDESRIEQETFSPKPARACVKCGTLLYQNTAFCPNCGNPLGKVQSTTPMTA